jgi:hypothetical protein
MQLCIKQLTPSDLSFFRTHLQKSKQKGINLNRDVFVDVLFPGLRNTATEYPFPLTLVGPGGRAAYRLTRKVTRSAGAKNWRLNGELVSDPVDEPGRYDQLQAGDFAVFGFEGSERPESLVTALLSVQNDVTLHALISGSLVFEGRRTMLPLVESQVAAWHAQTRSSYADQHPLSLLLAPDTPEDALFANDLDPRTEGRSTPLTQDELLRQLRAAEETGRLGESLFAAWLDSVSADEENYEWVSAVHARAAFDFIVEQAPLFSKLPCYVDVKTTRGEWEQPIHMSAAELRWAASHSNYRLARISGLSDGRATLRILDGVSDVARQILTSLEGLPQYASIDSVRFVPSTLTIEGFVELAFLDEPD